MVDLRGMSTETRNPASETLDAMSALEIVTLMNKEDRKVPEAIESQLGKIAEAAEAAVSSFEKGGRLIYIGAGTSGRLGVVDASECPPTFGVPEGMVIGLIAGGERAFTKAVEGAEDSPGLGRRDLEALGLTASDTVIGIAASGRTPYVIGALLYAKETGARTVAIVCNKGSRIAELSDIAIEVEAGPEVLTGSTRLKAGTAEKLVLNMISTASMVRLGKCYSNLMVDVVQSNEKLESRAENIVIETTGVTREEARKALKEAGGSVKKAVVMLLKGCSADDAGKCLMRAKGHVREALA